MKVLFLDMDGVLNTLKTLRSEWPDDIDGNLLQHLQVIMEETDAVIVLTSSWRLYNSSVRTIMDRFNECGFGHRLIDKTPDLKNDAPRSDEIMQWMIGKDITAFAILDDEDDAGFGLEQHLFKTRTSVGLTEEIARKIIQHLMLPTEG